MNLDDVSAEWAERARRSAESLFINHPDDEWISPEEIMDVLWEHGNVCYYCGKEMEIVGRSYIHKNDWFSIDHVVPGLHRVDNLVVACMGCNRKKQDNTPEDLRNLADKIDEFKNSPDPELNDSLDF